MEDKVRENRLRRKAERLGVYVKKSRARNWSINNRRGYMLIDPKINCILYGVNFDLNLDDLESVLDSLEKEYMDQ